MIGHKEHLASQFFRAVLPAMLAFTLSGIYGITDGFFVGNALGDSALAAINVAYPLTALLQSMGTGIGMGGAVEYSLGLGSQNPQRSREFYSLSLFLLCSLGLVFTGILLVAGAPLLRLFGASGEIYTLGCEYIFFIALGSVFQILGTGLVPFIRNMDGPIIAMYAMIAGFGTNIVLDYLLVWKFPLGMTGAALATDIGQGITFLVCLGFFIKKKEKPLFRFQESVKLLLQRLIKVGMSPFGLTFAPNIALILINKSAVLYGGNLAVTCYAPVSYINWVGLMLLQGVSDGSQPLFSLSWGAGKKERAWKFCKMAFGFSLFTAAVSMALIFCQRHNLGSLFGTSPQVNSQISHILPVFLAGYLFAAVSRVSTAYFYATGKNFKAYLLIYGEPVFLAILLAVLPSVWGIQRTWTAVPLSQMLAAGLSLVLMASKP